MGQQQALLRFGQRVRVMQTTEMEERGLANCRGTVMCNQRTLSHMIRVALDEDNVPSDHEELGIDLPSHSLMRVETHTAGEAEGK